MTSAGQRDQRPPRRPLPACGMLAAGPGVLLLAELAGEPAGLVAVWRPGEPRIAVRRVRFPEPGPPGGLRFVIW